MESKQTPYDTKVQYDSVRFRSGGSSRLQLSWTARALKRWGHARAACIGLAVGLGWPDRPGGARLGAPAASDALPWLVVLAISGSDFRGR